MKKFADFIVNHSGLIVIISLLLLIPSIIGYKNTRINYDILVYLPDTVDTIKGENILTDEFGLGSYAFVITDSKDTNKSILALEEKIKKIEGVNTVASLIDVIDTSIPSNMLPNEILDKLYKDGSTIIMVTFEGSTSGDSTITAVRELRELVSDASSVSSMTSMVIDTMDLSNQEIAIYVVIAVLFCLVVLLLATDSYVVPLFLLGNIGIAILYNMGTNIFLGEISYITKAISAILQLGVTTDFSIFLYHKYEEAKEKYKDKRKSMSVAIIETFNSVIGSSLTTFAGFLALCTMDLTLGTDIGIVMAKGVLCGLITVLTLFPSLLLVFDKIIEKTKHKNLFPKFTKLNQFIVNHQKGMLLVFLILLVPALIGNAKVESYYKLDDSLPDNLPFKIANNELKEKYGITSPEIILISKDVKTNDIKELITKLENIEGMDFVISPSTIINSGMVNMLPEDFSKILNNENYQLIIANSAYEIASDELNDQINEVNDIVKEIDKDAIIAGEGALMKDLVEIADHDFKMVNYTSIIVIFVIMICVLKQISLPIILVLTIEFAICLNMSIPYYTGVKLPFIASIVVGTIQLGATIDYAILMSTRYLEERKQKDKKEAMLSTLTFTTPAIITSALCFFAATFGVAIYTKIDMIGSICELLARGSIISMLVVILILPAMLMLFDKIIVKKKEGKNMEGKNMKKQVIAGALALVLMTPFNVFALEKKETVYTNLNRYGEVSDEVVSNYLKITGDGTLEEETELENILNITGDEKFTLNENKLVWQTKAQDIIYEGKSKKENPLQFQVTYYLDEKETKLEDMIGKSGSVRVKITITNKDYVYKNSKKLYVPFVVLFATTLDNNNSDITITNGKVINTGTRSSIVSIASPGIYESTNINELKSMNEIVLEYKTKDFKASDYYFVASPKVLEETDFQVFDQINVLNKNMNTIGNSMNTIDAGAKKLLDGTTSLEKGSSEITANLKNALNALTKLDTGAKDIDKNLSLIIKSLKQTESDLQNKDMSGSITNLNTLKAGNTKAMNELSTKNASLKAEYETEELNKYNTREELIMALTEKGYDNSKITYDVTLKETYEGNNTLIYLLKQNNAAIDTTIETLTETYSEVSTLITKLESVLAELEAGTNTLSSGLNTLKTGVNALYLGTNTLANGATSLNNGMLELSNGISTLNKEGISKLVSYSKKINNYSNTLKDLTELSKNYKGYGSNNATNTTFIYKLDQNK